MQLSTTEDEKKKCRDCGAGIGLQSWRCICALVYGSKKK